MATEKTLESANKFYDSELINDARVFSAKPKDWDAIKDLDMTYIGYYDLPGVFPLVIAAEELLVPKSIPAT